MTSQTSIVKIHDLYNNSCLKANSYCQDGYNYLKLLKRDKHKFGETKLKTVADIYQVFVMSPVTRYGSPDREDTLPYYSPSELRKAQPQAKHIIMSAEPRFEKLVVDQSIILMSGSGTVGIPFYPRKDLGEKYIAWTDTIRFKPQNILKGYLYAYLSSDVFQSILKCLEIGSVVQHLAPHHISDLPIPIFPQPLMLEIHNLVEEAAQLRADANLMTLECIHNYESMFNLKDLNYKNKKNTSKVSLFQIESRLDASYYHNQYLDYNKYMNNIIHKVKIKDVGKVYLPNRFKRIFVDKQFGVSMFGITGINQLIPQTNKYLSTKFLNQDLIVEKGDILTARSGTIGITGICPSYLEGKSFSEDVIRIRAQENYRNILYLFLNTKIGKSLIQKESFGSVIIHINASQIENIEFPYNEDCKELSKKLEQALDFRGLAYQKENQAIALVEKALK